jgi:hypothetical protein
LVPLDELGAVAALRGHGAADPALKSTENASDRHANWIKGRSVSSTSQST